MTKTDLPYDTAGEILRSEIPPPDQGVHTRGRSDRIWFSSKLFEKLSAGPKNDLERRPLRFSTICTKNQVLKINIDKVTTILRRKSPSSGDSSLYLLILLNLVLNLAVLACSILQYRTAVPSYVQL